MIVFAGLLSAWENICLEREAKVWCPKFSNRSESFFKVVTRIGGLGPTESEESESSESVKTSCGKPVSRI